MGQYRLAIYSNLSLGFGIEYHSQPKALTIRIPFLSIYIGMTHYARGTHTPWSK